MKNLTLLVILIIGLIGCGSSTHKKSENSEINTSQNEDNISDDIQDEKIEVKKIINKAVASSFWSSELFNHKTYFKLLETEESYDTFLNEVKVDGLDKNTSKENIDFKKYKLLVSTIKAVKEMGNHKSEIKIEDNGSIEIKELAKENNLKLSIYSVNLRVYKISRFINKLKLITKDETFNIDMNRLNPSIYNDKVINYFSGNICHSYIFMTKVFDNNDSYQEFLDATPCSKIFSKKVIDFNKYRVLFKHNTVFKTNFDFYRKEVISFPNTESAIIDFKSMYPFSALSAVNPEMYGIVSVYKVLRDISTVTMGSFRNSYSPGNLSYFKIDMESGDLEEVDSDAVE